MSEEILQKIKYNAEGLIPVVIQEYQTDRILMLAYMNEESLKKTLETGKTVFWSRSRKALWKKGETSGSEQTVKEVYLDCDEDTLLMKVAQENGACHTGHYSCFYRKWNDHQLVEKDTYPGINQMNHETILDGIYKVILQRKQNPDSNSYVSSLFTKGQDAILKKIAEEAGEIVLSSKNQKTGEIVWEVADLWFHTLVVLGFHGIPVHDLFEELERRKGKSGLKK